MPSARRGAQALHTPGGIITYARSNYYIRQGVWTTRAKCSQEEAPRHHFSEATDVPRREPANREAERAAPRCHPRAEEHKHYIRQVESLHAPGRIITYARVCGQPRAKCSQEEVPRHHFSEATDVPRLEPANREAERAAPRCHPRAEEHKHYIRQVESLHTPGRIITYARVCGQPRAKCSQEEVPRHHFSEATDVPR